jgi:hypothetical protein
MKECRSCKVEKSDEDFYKRAINIDGLYSYCKECTKEKNRNISEDKRKLYREINREYKEKNKQILLEKSKKYYYKNRISVLKKAEKYREKNKIKISRQQAIRRSNDEERFEINRIKHFEWSKKNREKLNEYQRVWYQKNKEKRRAHVLLNRAVKSGEIMRPQNCSQCLKLCKPDGHHINYDEPLEVIWLCKTCHTRKSKRTIII